MPAAPHAEAQGVHLALGLRGLNPLHMHAIEGAE